MKIDRSNPVHWWRLASFAACVLLSIFVRPFRRTRDRRRVVFYGHRLSGNLLPIYRRLRERHGADVEVTFITMDPVYYAELFEAGELATPTWSLAAVDWLSSASAIVTDHGLHSMAPLLFATRIRFFDVWHGIPFKGFDASDFRIQRAYDGVWVASGFMKRMYEERFGFDQSKVKATGYARTDELIDADAAETAEIRKEFGLPATGQVVLFAPTWQQDDVGRSIYPFGECAATFIAMLSTVAVRHGATVVVRQHLNSGMEVSQAAPGVCWRPFATWPATERLLRVTDVLICDWSSIAFDFLLMDRATIFIDVEPPFRKGLSLGPTFRVGTIVQSMHELEVRLDSHLGHTHAWMAEFGAAAQKVREQVYGPFADGNATSRCVEQLLMHLAEPG